MDILFYFIGLVPLCFPISILAPTNTNISIRGFRENLVQILFFHRIRDERRLAIRSLSLRNFKRIFKFFLYPYIYFHFICWNVDTMNIMNKNKLQQKYKFINSQDSSLITFKCFWLFYGLHTGAILSYHLRSFCKLKINLKFRSLFSRALIEFKLKFPTASL